MKVFIIVAAAFATLAAMPANAASYLLSYSGSFATTASVRINTSNTAVLGGFAVLSVTGNVNGDVITGLAGLNPPGFLTDNTYYNADPIFTGAGIGFFSATTTYNLWGNGPGSYSLYGTADNGGSYSPASDGTLSITAVPEPATWALMVLGFGMTGFAARRRKAALTA